MPSVPPALPLHYGLQRVFPLRPVAARVIARQQGIEPGPPSEAEKADAILLLADPYQDDVGDEAFRILDEYGR